MKRWQPHRAEAGSGDGNGSERAGAGEELHAFKGVSSEGWDVYEVAFENETMEWRFILADDGRMSGAWIRPLLQMLVGRGAPPTRRIYRCAAMSASSF